MKAFALIIFITGAILFLSFPAAGGGQVWVSPTGNDNNPGTAARPMTSIARAQEKARELSGNTNGAAPVEIILRSGIYPLSAPLRLTPADSNPAGVPDISPGLRRDAGRYPGKPSSRIIFNPERVAEDSHGLIISAAPGETPIISGGVQITHWKLAGHINGLQNVAQAKVWVANAPQLNGRFLEFRQLWVNGMKAVRAREPNAPELARLVAWDKTNQVATIPVASLCGLKDPARLEMVIDQVWEIAVLRVKALEVRGTNALVRFKEPEGGIEFRHPWPPVIVKTNYHAPFFLANAIEFLDSPGEWFEDLRAGKVYYWPRDGEDLKHAKCFAPALETLLDIEGTSDKPAANITFKGITFAHTTWLRPSEQGHVPLQAGMFLLDARKLSPKGTPYHRGLDNLACIGRPPAAVSVKSAEHIVFENCAFEHLASAGLDFQMGTHDDSVQGCAFRDIGGNGIQLGKFSDTNVETHMPYNPSDEHEIRTNERIEDNVITDCANEDWGGVGIGVGYARGVKIEHNDVFNCSYTGISVGWGWTKMTNALRDNFIHANHVYRVATRMNDTAGIYTLSAQPGTIISENSIEDIQPSPYVPDPLHWFYLYLDEGSSFITVRNNWCPAEKFLKNANGPGNVWENNGPQVSENVRAAAGLEPAFRHLLSR